MIRTRFTDNWEFAKLPFGSGCKEAESASFTAVSIPHDWLIGGEDLYETSTGWYRCPLHIDADCKKALLRFDGIYMDCTIRLDGEVIGEWKYGYSAFTVDVSAAIGKDALLEVEIRHESPNTRWYSGAGIFRDVWLYTAKEAYFIPDGVYVSSQKAEDGWHLSVCAEAAALSSEEELMTMKASVVPAGTQDPELLGGDFVLCAKEQRHAPTARSLGATADVKNAVEEDRTLVIFEGETVVNPEVWSPSAPHRYRLQLTLACGMQIIDTTEVIFGFRQTELDPEKGFFLNGEHLKLHGVCEHHDYGALGAAFSETACRRKFEILRSMGVNAVRLTHNMTAERLLEIADETGMLLISEAFDMWEMSKTPKDYGRFFKEWEARDVASWVRRDRNHPSVIFWSIGNEIYDTQASDHGQEITAALAKQVHSHDPNGNAYVTIGSNFMMMERARKCSDIIKVAGYNYGEAMYDSHHAEHPDWVMYGSETSSIVYSRGVYHFPAGAPILSDEDSQCSSLGNSSTSWGARSWERCYADNDLRPYIMGQFLWSGFDYIGEPTPYHTRNSYFGQIDTAGFPKDAYYFWKAAWTDAGREPMVHLFPYWDFNEGETVDVAAVSNLPETELFVNGKSYGKRQTGHGKVARWVVAYHEGSIEAVSCDGSGNVLACDRHVSFGDTAALVLTTEKGRVPVMTAGGQDELYLVVETKDAFGRAVENASDRVFVETEGVILAGTDNGDSTDQDSYKASSRRLFNGKLLLILRSAGKSGTGRVRVTSPGLKPAELTITVLPSDVERTPVSAGWQCSDRPVHTGRGVEEKPVRTIKLTVEGSRSLSPENAQALVRASLLPFDADDRELVWQVVNDQGIPLNTAELTALDKEKHEMQVRASRDGKFTVRCLSRAGSQEIRLISAMDFVSEGFGNSAMDPYADVIGGLYSYSNGQISSGNEKGVATARLERTEVGYKDLDFGDFGSDTITMDIFALSSDPYPIELWEGIPGEAGAQKICEVVYQKPSIWNVYQAMTFRLPRRLKGLITLTFVTQDKLHLRAFRFEKQQKAFASLSAGEADAVYGDSFRKDGERVLGIGNNVTLAFENMDFGETGAGSVTISGHANHGSDSITLITTGDNGADRQVLNFVNPAEGDQLTFPIRRLKGVNQVSVVFLPGADFDLFGLQFHQA